MASGYTHKLHEGEQEFSEFILDCARAFGAYIHLRDEPHAVLSKINDCTADYQRRVDRASEEYVEFTALSEFEQRDIYDKEIAEIEKHEKESRENKKAVAERYGKMLGKVLAWQAPKELENLKEFMKEQLESSIEFDCKVYKSRIREFGDWLDDKVSYLERSIERAEEQVREEKKRVKEQHAWHEALLKAAKEFD